MRHLAVGNKKKIYYLLLFIIFCLCFFLKIDLKRKIKSFLFSFLFFCDGPSQPEWVDMAGVNPARIDLVGSAHLGQPKNRLKTRNQHEIESKG
jgi:hypothetical protein